MAPWFNNSLWMSTSTLCWELWISAVQGNITEHLGMWKSASFVMVWHMSTGLWKHSVYSWLSVDDTRKGDIYTFGQLLTCHILFTYNIWIFFSAKEINTEKSLLRLYWAASSSRQEVIKINAFIGPSLWQCYTWCYGVGYDTDILLSLPFVNSCWCSQDAFRKWDNYGSKRDRPIFNLTQLFGLFCTK